MWKLQFFYSSALFWERTECCSKPLPPPDTAVSLTLSCWNQPDNLTAVTNKTDVNLPNCTNKQKMSQFAGKHISPFNCKQKKVYLGFSYSLNWWFQTGFLEVLQLLGVFLSYTLELNDRLPLYHAVKGCRRLLMICYSQWAEEERHLKVGSQETCQWGLEFEVSALNCILFFLVLLASLFFFPSIFKYVSPAKVPHSIKIPS